MSLFKSALYAALCLFAVGSASATPILDQQNTVMSSQLNGGSIAYEWQQGITAGLTGQLTTIEVFAFGAAGTTQLFVNQGAPWQSDVNDWSTVALINPGWNSFDLTTANIFLHAGDQFVLGFHGAASIFEPGMGFSYGNLYAGGELFLNGFPSTGSTDPGHDLDFRTYVEPVSEPSTLALLGISLAGLGFSRRRKA